MPAHDHVLLTIRTRLERELSQLLRRKARLGTLRPVVDEAPRPDPLRRWTPSRSIWRSSLGGATGAEPGMAASN